jgi:hypothetical protein
MVAVASEAQHSRSHTVLSGPHAVWFGVASSFFDRLR